MSDRVKSHVACIVAKIISNCGNENKPLLSRNLHMDIHDEDGCETNVSDSRDRL